MYMELWFPVRHSPSQHHRYMETAVASQTRLALKQNWCNLGLGLRWVGVLVDHIVDTFGHVDFKVI